MSAPLTLPPAVVYPDSDGEPMADNSLQAELMIALYQGLTDQFAQRPDVAVHTNLFWYPVEGRPDIVRAPEVMVIFGRPPQRRGFYKQWEEENVAPQVVFEIYAAGNKAKDLLDKFFFYDRYRVEEYYFFDPDEPSLSGWRRADGEWVEIPQVNGFTSPRLGLTFHWDGSDRFDFLDPAGKPLPTHEEVLAALDEERRRADEEKRRADEERRRAEQIRRRADRLAEELRKFGVDPDQLTGGGP